MPARWRGSLLLRVTVGSLLAGVLATALISGLLIRDAERETEARARQVVLQDAVHGAASLSRRLMERQRSLLAAAQTVQEPRQWDTSSDAHPGLAVLFDEIFMSDPQGQVFSAWGERLSAPALQALLPHQTGFLGTVREARPMIWLLPEAVAQGAAAVFTQPVIRGGRVQAVLGGVIWLRQGRLMSDVVEAGPDFGEGAISQLLAVTDSRGRPLVSGDAVPGTSPAAAAHWLSEARREWQAQGSPVEPEGLVWSDGDQIVVAAGIPGPDWVIWRAYSRAAMMAPLDALRERSLRWALGTWAGLSLVLLFYLGWQLSPLAQLERRVVALLDGRQAPQDGWPMARGEIGALSATLHSVALALAHKDSENRQLVERLESVMAAAPLGLVFVREDRLTLVNAELARLLGYTPKELRGLPARLLLADVGDADRMRHRLERVALRPDAVAEVVGRDALTGATLSWKRTRAATETTRGVRMFFLELAEERPQSAVEAAAPVTGIDHIVISTSDPEGAAALYGARLGLDMALGVGGLPIAMIVGVSYALWAGLCVAFIAFEARPTIEVGRRR